MNDYRGILAFVACLAGFVLLIVAVRALASRTVQPLSRKRAATLAMYGGLFFAAGLLLWSRRGVLQPSEELRTSESVNQSAPLALQTRTVGDSARAAAPDVAADSVEQHALDPAPMDSARTSTLAGVPAQRRQAFRDTVVAHVAPRQIPAGVDDILFPPVSFEKGSTELTVASKAALSNFAVGLKRKPEINLEIQVYIDSLDGQAGNFALSQSRASVIRDLLVVKGVAASRLMAQGFGSPSESPSPVSFVVRR